MHYDRWRRTGDVGEVEPQRVHRYAPGTPCKIVDCGRPALARGWCEKHYARWRKTRGFDVEIDDLRYQHITGGPCTVADCDGVVVAKGLCRRCYARAKNQRDRATHPDRYLGYHLNRYGMTVDEYRALVDKQEGRCAICDDAPERRLCVDHNHETGQVRALLCTTCNTGIGAFLEDPGRLERAIAYLHEWAAR